MDTMDTPEWLYARLHHTSHQDGELLLGTLVPDWAAAAERLGAARWFFIRYADADGPHLRLRFYGPPAAMDACWAAGRELWRRSDRRRTAPGEVRRLHPAAEDFTPRRGHRRLSLGVYSREHHYYGSPAATEIAEEVFQASSRAALATVAATGADRTARALLALEFLRACTGSLGPAQRSRVWRLHWRHWTAVLDGDPTGLGQAEESAARWRAAARAGAADQAEPLVRLAERVVDGVHRALAVDPEAVASRLLLMHMHMTLNRLGFLPLEEAVLGRAAQEGDHAVPVGL
ncbi:thiopeptide-type bacteriocin biosynthesis protein [Streptomyces sp. HNM0663]|uniref:Thiopeptide-type bacteriocin biosynthesis protein n=1 Tax=Streptomyces chengmaiensis TaxID=3040919 RepID=A0ABT6HV61_9ACTN|nr:thiopeptide-type bacteriocin biosynthesis protein [Streptomyces chengmaiensis]MDH2392163.1 thiopeptide-type bacteriocin biosynthesis protein [Streptomyces chengmaiensis]